MEEEEEETSSSPPFWMDSGGQQRRLRRSYSLFLSWSAVGICIMVIALAFTLVIIPTLHSFTTTIFKSHFDSLIFLLILFAILCAFLTNNNADQTFSDTPQQPDHPTPYKSYNTLRSFNSYPDLRQDSPWLPADERCRFYDDTNLNGYRGFDFEEAGEEEIVVQNIQVAPPERESGENQSATKELLTSLKGKKKKHGEASVENLFVSNKREGYYASEEENVVVTTGNESPLNPIPPPPPPPPFKMLPAWKFRVKGDFVRIDSISSSSSDSADLEDQVMESAASNEEPEILVFYNPSPDVDTKAGTFIQRFRAGLRMEEKQGIATSNLRPSPATI